MRKIVIKDQRKEVLLSEVNTSNPIFAKRKGVLAGMVVKEDTGWILRIGGTAGCNGFKETLQELIESIDEFGYELYTN